MPRQIVINLDKKYSSNPLVHHLLLILVTIFSYLVVLEVFNFSLAKTPITIVLFGLMYYLIHNVIKKMVFRFKDLGLVIILYPFVGIVSLLAVSWILSNYLIFRSFDDLIYFYLLASLMKMLILKLIERIKGGKKHESRV